MGERGPGKREREQASSIGTLGELFERAAGSAKGVRFLDREERARFYPYAQMYARAARAGSSIVCHNAITPRYMRKSTSTEVRRPSQTQ